MCDPLEYMPRESIVELGSAGEGTHMFNDMMQTYECFIEDNEYDNHPLLLLHEH
jgi:hypothetical protein